jgi:anti-anti-sigma regulatory factor
LCLHLTRGLPSLSLMAEAAAHDWIGGAAFALLVIDLKEIENLNSLLVSWLLQLSHAAAPVRAVLSNPSAQAATQLRQLRLDHILTVC